jgi:hypothetical protein
MTKTPGAVQPPKQLTKAERDARKAFRQVDAQKAMTEHEIAQKAFSNNRERLKAERLAREAAGPPPSKTKRQRPRQAEKTVPSVRVTRATRRSQFVGDFGAAGCPVRCRLRLYQEPGTCRLDAQRR